MIEDALLERLSRREMLALGCGAANFLCASSTPRKQEAEKAVTRLQSFDELFGSPERGVITLPARTISITRPLLLRTSHVHIKGTAGATKITSDTVRGIMRLGSISDVVFEDVEFSTFAEGGKIWNSGGVVYSNNASLLRVTFIRCRFSSPRTPLNGLKIVTDTSEVDGLHFQDCNIESVGRMGFEIQAHLGNQVRYENVTWEGGSVKNTGLHGIGMGISLSGYGRNCTIDSTFSNNAVAIENVGCSSSRFSGRFEKQRADVIAFTGKRVMEDNTIRGVVCSDEARGNLTLRNQRRLRSENGNYQLRGQVRLRNVAESSFRGETYRCRGQAVLFIEGAPNTGGEQGPSTNNIWEDCIFDARNMTGQGSAIRFQGMATRNDIARSCRILVRKSNFQRSAGTSNANRISASIVTDR